MTKQNPKNTFNSLVSNTISTILAIGFSTGLMSCQINSPREELNSVETADSKPKVTTEPGKIDPKYSMMLRIN